MRPHPVGVAIVVAACGSPSETGGNPDARAMGAVADASAEGAAEGAAGDATDGSTADAGDGTTDSPTDGDASVLADGPPVDAGSPTGPPTLGATSAIATLIGRFATPAPGQANIGFYATDLGWTFVHDGALQVLFGDSWSNPQGTDLGSQQDDVLGQISLGQFGGADAVEAWVTSHAPAAGQPSWHAAAPSIGLQTNAQGNASPIRLSRDGTILETSFGLTPETGFSNARGDTTGAAFILYFMNDYVPCSGGSTPTCPGGFTCDTGLGLCGPLTNVSMPCAMGTTSCACSATAGGGLCQDRTSSTYDSTERGRIESAVVRQEVGNADPTTHELFYVQPWPTNKFFNATARTVRDFDPARAAGVGNDYRAADGSSPGSEKVFLWGRPGFAGTGANGRDLELYFAYVDMPSFDPKGHFAWTPQYFTGLSLAGAPQFSSDPTAAIPLDLDDTTPGDQPKETWDIVNQNAVSYVPALGAWIMLYGGDLPASFLAGTKGDAVNAVQRDPQGAIHARFAKQPWGPWSPPQELFAGGDKSSSTVSGQYVQGGILRHPSCSDPTCAPNESVYSASELGVLYGANVIDPWMVDRGDHVDFYWNVSTWDPYEVVLMRSSVVKPR